MNRVILNANNYEFSANVDSPSVVSLAFLTISTFQGKFLWPGFGENARVLDWVLRRCDNEPCHQETPLGFVPKDGALNIDGLGQINTEELFRIPKDFWMQEVMVWHY